MTNDALIAAARAWQAEDPDPATRDATRALLDAGDLDTLRDCFGARLAFGTAGLRGALGPGPNRMNRANVRRVTAGLADYLLMTHEDAPTRGVVVGFDGRVGSREFAEDTARVLAGRGLRAWLYDDVTPTPELAHAVVALGCAAGVMVTASHNPPGDNGYKVYWDNGAQIVPPHDEGIAGAIDRLEGLSDVDVPSLQAVRSQGHVRPVPAGIRQRYLDAVSRLRVHADTRTDLRIVYTAMHGVGADLVERVLRDAGYDQLHFVAAQREPDGAFPTVRFPNPEEPGALDLALELANEVDADLVIANDPDGDRLAVAVPDGSGGYRALTGNQVGVLLGEDLLAHGTQWNDAPRLVATTIVSSTMLSRIAAAHRSRYAETLTGFKWIANRAIEHDARGGHFVLGYEEALGYSVGPVVRDKDGVSAALLFCDLAGWCKANGRTVLEHLSDLYRRYGYHGGSQKSVVLPGAEGRDRMVRVMADLRADPPAAIGGVAVVRLDDVYTRRSVDHTTGETHDLDLPRSNVLAFHLVDGSRVLVRPSGTEPKIKFYFEVCEDLAEGETLEQVASRADSRIAVLRDAILERVGLEAATAS